MTAAPLTASAVVAADHFLRGLLWPQSVYGVLADSGWRWLEHAGWVAFEDVFLIYSCLRGVQEMRGIADRQALLEAAHAGVEAMVENTADAIWSVDRDLRLVTFNAAFRDGVERTCRPRPRPGQEVMSVVQPDLAGRWAKCYARASPGSA